MNPNYNQFNDMTRSRNFDALQQSILHDKEEQLKDELKNYSKRRKMSRRRGENIMNSMTNPYRDPDKEMEYNRRINFFDDKPQNPRNGYNFGKAADSILNGYSLNH